VPADADALHAEHRRGDERHLVILGVAGPAGAVPDLLPRTILPAPPHGADAAEHLLRSPDLLAAAVGALVASDLPDTRHDTAPDITAPGRPA
jgi:hypothetical protein